MSLEIYSMSIDREQELRNARMARTQLIRSAIEDKQARSASTPAHSHAWQRALQVLAAIGQHHTAMSKSGHLPYSPQPTLSLPPPAERLRIYPAAFCGVGMVESAEADRFQTISSSSTDSSGYARPSSSAASNAASPRDSRREM